MPESTDNDPDADAVLDAAALHALHALDPGGRARLVARLLQAFAESLGKLLPEIERAGAERDWDTVQRHVHLLRSSSASIGALDFARGCAATEEHLRGGRRDATAAGIPALCREGRRALGAVQAILDRP